MAAATDRGGQHRFMGPALDLVMKLCLQRSIPDCATMVVKKQELVAGTLKPSEEAIEKHGGWPQLRQEQAACLTFDWAKVT